MQPYNNISSSYKIDTGIEGPKVSIFSGIHGDEPSGIMAHKRFFTELQSGKIQLEKGQLLGVLEANEEAIRIGKRQVEKNLNRVFLETNTSCETYEDKRFQELKQLLKESDYLLDLHSTSGPSIPFSFAEKHTLAFAKKVGFSHIITGWGELGGDVIAGDTETYMNSLGGIGLTFEAGNHDNPDGEKVAYQTILNYLVALDMLDKKYFQKIGDKNVYVEIQNVYIAKTDKFHYNIHTENFLPIAKGTRIGTDGEEAVTAKEDMILVMPKAESILKKGVEIFFIGKEIT